MSTAQYIMYCLIALVVILISVSCSPVIEDLSKKGSNPRSNNVGYLTLMCREKDTKCTDNLKDVCRNAELLEERTEEGRTIRKYKCGTP